MIEIADTGAYRIGHEQLLALAPELGEVASNRLQLSVGGEARRLHVEDGGDGRFGPGDHVSFFGERLHGSEGWFNTYAVHNVYTLSIADAPTAHPPAAAPMSAHAEAELRRQLHLEEENLQIRLSNRWVQPGDEPDLWHWAKLTQVDPEPFQAPFVLPGLAEDGEVTLRLGFRGLSEIRRTFGQVERAAPDHVVEVRLNGELVKTTNFQERHAHEIEINVSARRLTEDSNQLELRVPQRTLPGAQDAVVDVVMFNYVNVDYPISGTIDHTPLPLKVSRGGRVTLHAEAKRSLVLYGRDGSRFEASAQDGSGWLFPALVSSEFQPVIDGGYSEPITLRRAADAGWRTVEQGYDYLLIAHPSLMAASRPLADHHRSQGLRVAEVDVMDLYDEFNHGILHPSAIRDFIAHAHHQWPQPRPRLVLLVGDASFDIRSERADDHRYAKWTNQQRELLRPGEFGTIPGGQYAEGAKVAAARNLIPTWQYPSEEGHSAADNYFVAVDGDDWLPDLALGRLPVVEPQEVAGIVAKTIRYASAVDFGDWRRRVLFTTDTNSGFQRSSTAFADGLAAEGFLPTTVYPDADALDNLPQISSLSDALNDGQLLVHFIGHGGRYIWRTGPPDPRRNHDLFTLDHVAELRNGDRLPMVISMSCYSAPFDHPNADSIGERFLREPDGGAIAVFAASWRNSPSTAFSEATIAELMTPGASIGEGLMRAKRTLTNQWQRTLVETYNLLGDPAVVLKRPSLPVQLQVRTPGQRSHVEMEFGKQTVNGRAILRWLDESDVLLATSEHELRGRRATVTGPQDAHRIEVHVLDYNSRSDGFADLHLFAHEQDPGSGLEPVATASSSGDEAGNRTGTQL